MKRDVVVAVVAVAVTLGLQRLRKGSGGGAASAPVAGDGSAGTAAPYQRLSVSDAVLEKMRDQAAQEAVAREAARTPGPNGNQGPLEPLEPQMIVETLKSRFAPGEKPTTEKVRVIVADITADAERRWASAALARIVADCKAGKMDDFLALAAPSAPAAARREKCAAEAPRWRGDILKAYKEEAATARAALEGLKSEIRQLTPGEGEAVQEKVNGLTRPVDVALERLDGRTE